MMNGPCADVDGPSQMDRRQDYQPLRRVFVAILTMMGSTGCVELDTEIHVRRDGSATVSQTVFVTSEALSSLLALDDGGLMDEPHLKARAAHLGSGVEYLGASEIVREDGTRGYVVRYELSDIADLALTANTLFAPVPGEDASLDAWTDDGVMWDFVYAPGNEPVLSIVQRWQDLIADSADANTGSGTPEDEFDTLAYELGKAMLEDLRMRVHVRVDGPISETNARYINPEESRVRLWSIDVGQVLEDLERVAQAESPAKRPNTGLVASVARLGDELTDVQIDTQRVIRVKFGGQVPRRSSGRDIPRAEDWRR